MGSPRPAIYSTATLDSLVCPLLVDYRKLKSCLPVGAQLSLPRLPYVPEGKHPVIVEIWRVRNGLIQFGDLDAHNLWELAGGMAGIGFGGGAGAAIGAGLGGAAGAARGGALGMGIGPLGALWGTMIGAAAGASQGATMMARAGAVRAAHWAAAAGRKTSENNSRVIGSYNEVLVTVPCSRFQRQMRGFNYSYVLATYTDSPASMLGEWLVGWGYRKSPAVGRRAQDGALELTVGPSRPPFRIVSHWEASPCPASALTSANSQIPAMMSLPVLGILPGNRLMVSFLDRALESPSVHVTSSSVSLEGDDAFLPALGRINSKVDGFETCGPWGAFLITGLPVLLSYPRDVDR